MELKRLQKQKSQPLVRMWVRRCQPLRMESNWIENERSRCHSRSLAAAGTWKAATLPHSVCTSGSRNPAPPPSSLLPPSLPCSPCPPVSLDPVVGPPCSLQMQLPPSTVSRVITKREAFVAVVDTILFIPLSEILNNLYSRQQGHFDPARLSAQEYGLLVFRGTS